MRKLLKDDADDEPLTKKSKIDIPHMDDEPLFKRLKINVADKDDEPLFKRLKINVDDKDDEPLIKRSKITIADTNNEPLWNKTNKNTIQSHCPFGKTTELKPTDPAVNNVNSMNFQNLKDRSLENSGETETAKKNSKLVQLSQIGDGDHTSIQNYFDSFGYVYSQNRKKGTTLYLRCKNSTLHKCKASVIVRDDKFEEGLMLRNHNHESVRKDLDRVRFNKKLEQICRQNPFITAQCAFQQAKDELAGKIILKNIPSLKSFESLIYRLQKVDVPLHPKTVEDLENLILHSQYEKKYTRDLRGNLFHRGIWRGPTGANVPFVSETVLQAVRKEKNLEFLMDGTFKVLPHHIKFRQLYIINVIIEKRSYPLAFILMERKDTQSYELVLNEIKNLISSKFRTIKFMTDYEAATRKALKKVYPEAEIYGCFFHYVQAITKRFRKFGLNKNNDKFGEAMQKISALALLPNEYIVPGFEYIAKSFRKSTTFARFAAYWRKQWANANISVYGLENRTNNFAESLNKTINALIGRKHPHIWRLIHNLQFVEKYKSDEVERVLDYQIVKERNKSALMRELNEKIQFATKEFEERLCIKTFLCRMASQENFQLKFKERIFIDGVDVDEEFDEDDDDDEVIPNNFRKISNFSKKQ